MAGRKLSINVEFITRVEGHGHIVIDMREGVLQSCRLKVVEAPRFFEALLAGRSIFEAQHITSRICGICACAHSLASIQAAEDAIGFTPSPQTLLLRKLLLHLENLDSHILHIYLLAAPDLIGVKSFMELMKDHSGTVRRALRMKKCCNDACDILVGRHVHPISCVIGGFTRLPKQKELGAMHALLTSFREELPPTVELLSSLTFPRFERETEYVALVDDSGEYPMLMGDVGSTDGVRKPKGEYRAITNEFIAPHSSAKHTRLSRSSYSVGALARFNLNSGTLHPKAKALAVSLGLEPLCCNPYLNSVAQLVECVHCTEEAIGIVEQFMVNGLDQGEVVIGGLNEKGAIPVRAGSGVGCVEAPRGTLYHNYEVNDQGIITSANCIIPTGQNLKNIEDDMAKLVPEIIDRSDEEITLALEMLVRAYDPCISCSTHVFDVTFVNR